MSDLDALTDRLADLVLEKVMAKLGAPAVVDDEVPEGNPIEYSPDTPALSLVNHETEPGDDDEVRSVIGEAFRTRASATPPPSPTEVQWEPIGDTSAFEPEQRTSSGHRLDDSQIQRDFARDMQARLRPGPTVEDEIAAQRAG